MLDKARLGVEDKGPGTNRTRPPCVAWNGYCAKCDAVKDVEPKGVGVLRCPDCGTVLERVEVK